MPALGGKSLHSLAPSVNGRARGWCISSRVNWSYVDGGPGLLFPVGSDGFFFRRVPERYEDRRHYRKTGLRLLAPLGTELQVVQRLSRLTLTHRAFWEIVALGVRPSRAPARLAVRIQLMMAALVHSMCQLRNRTAPR
jgi:hypothetical protein